MPDQEHVSRSELTKLEQIPNVGPAIAACLQRIGIDRPTDLRHRDPYALYQQLCEHDGKRLDPCVLDVMLAVTDFMAGNPGQPWWKYTAGRKKELARRAKADSATTTTQVGRRALLVNGTLVLLATQTAPLCAAFDDKSHQEASSLRFMMLTDLHYADKPHGGTRYYRETLAKLKATGQAATKFQPQFVVELGDVIDSADSIAQEKAYLKTIHQHLAALPGSNHYVLGNHCVYSLTKPEFLATVQQKKSYYSFDAGAYHCIILDGCFRSDGTPYGRKNYDWTDSNISKEQLGWLADDLKRNKRPVLAFIHQRLDVEGHYGVKNAAQVREILENSGNVQAVFQGHYHKNDYREIGAIHYCTLRAMVEGTGEKNNAFANVRADRDGTIHIAGFFMQKSYDWA